jgi:hypothetical protein
MKPKLFNWTQKQVDTILNLYPGKRFVLEYAYPLNNVRLTSKYETIWSTDTGLLFYEKITEYDSNYMLVYKDNGKIYVTSGQSLVNAINKEPVCIGYAVSEDEIIYSPGIHTMVTSKDGQYFVDGGPSYTRTNIPDEINRYNLLISNGICFWESDEDVNDDSDSTSDSDVDPDSNYSNDQHHYWLVIPSNNTDSVIMKTKNKEICFNDLRNVYNKGIQIQNIIYLGYFTEKEFYTNKSINGCII